MKKYIGLVLAVAAAAWLISRWEVKLPQAPMPSPQIRDNLVGWQDMVNKEYGYRVKMPHDWHQLQLEGEPAYPARLKLVNVKPEEQIKPHVGIIITVTRFKEDDLKAFSEIVGLTAEGREPKQLSVAGETGLFFDNLGESDEEFSLFIKHKDNVYRFDWTGTHPDVRQQYQDIGLKIIASLKFD